MLRLQCEQDLASAAQDRLCAEDWRPFGSVRFAMTALPLGKPRLNRAWRTHGVNAATLSICLLLAYASLTFAQSYPSKPVRFLSGQPPGGATDFFARMVAQKLNETWKQPIVIDHRPGASGS